MSKFMYRVSYGTSSWWTAIPRIQKREVVRVTAKTVTFKEPVIRYQDGECKKAGENERREHLKSDGVKWFDNFRDAKCFAVADQERKVERAKERLEALRENVDELNKLEDE